MGKAITLDPTVLAALIGALSALAVVLVKDIILDSLRESRRSRQELLNRRLSQLYSPLWIGFGGEQGVLANVMMNEDARLRLAENYHLLSSELRSIVDEALLLVRRKGDKWEANVTDMERLLELTPEFKRFLKRDFESLRSKLF